MRQHYSGEMGEFTILWILWCEISSGFCIPKIIKICWFFCVVIKGGTNRLRDLLRQCIYIHDFHKRCTYLNVTEVKVWIKLVRDATCDDAFDADSSGIWASLAPIFRCCQLKAIFPPEWMFHLKSLTILKVSAMIFVVRFVTDIKNWRQLRYSAKKH